MSRLHRVASSDKTKEVEGVWVDFMPSPSDLFRVKVRRAGGSNQEYHTAMEVATRGIRRSGSEVEKLPVAQQQKILAPVYARTIIADWDAQDFEVEFTPENAERMLLEISDFFEFIAAEANRAARYRASAIEESAGN